MITNVGWQKLVLYGPLEVLTLTFIYCAKARAFADGVGIVVTQTCYCNHVNDRKCCGATQAFRVMTATMMTTLGVLLLAQ
jgi:hypothetical protein